MVMTRDNKANNFEILDIENEEITKLQDGVNERYVTLFFSFDIVNSTQYKTIALKDSLKIIKNIFDEIEKLAFENIHGIEYWRTIGDEIIFYLEIYREEEILESVEYIFTILNKVKNKILNGEIKIDENQNRIHYRYPELISLKASAWLALVGEDDEKCLNVKYKTGYMKNDKRLEFQGHDIDVGFRVSEYTRNRRFALNFELAYFLSQYEICKDNLKFIGYKKMKGVWNQRKYPIIWYHNNKLKRLKDEGNLSVNELMIEKFEDSFFYDEEDFCELTKEFNDLSMNCKNENYKNNQEDIHKLLDRICKNINLIGKIKEIKEEILNKKSKERNIVNGVKNEIHITIIVMCNNKKEIILFKRASSAKYDFGYVKLEVCNIEINGIKKYIEKYYLDNFGVTVEVESKIYETYFVDKGEKRILGLRFLGVQKDDKLPKIKVSKYDSFKKVNVNNYTTLSYIEQNEFISLIGKIFQDKEGENNGME